MNPLALVFALASTVSASGYGSNIALAGPGSGIIISSNDGLNLATTIADGSGSIISSVGPKGPYASINGPGLARPPGSPFITIPIAKVAYAAAPVVAAPLLSHGIHKRSTPYGYGAPYLPSGSVTQVIDKNNNRQTNIIGPSGSVLNSASNNFRDLVTIQNGPGGDQISSIVKDGLVDVNIVPPSNYAAAISPAYAPASIAVAAPAVAIAAPAYSSGLLGAPLLSHGIHKRSPGYGAPYLASGSVTQVIDKNNNRQTNIVGPSGSVLNSASDNFRDLVTIQNGPGGDQISSIVKDGLVDVNIVPPSNYAAAISPAYAPAAVAVAAPAVAVAAPALAVAAPAYSSGLLAGSAYGSNILGASPLLGALHG